MCTRISEWNRCFDLALLRWSGPRRSANLRPLAEFRHRVERRQHRVGEFCPGKLTVCELENDPFIVMNFWGLNGISVCYGLVLDI